MKNDPDTQPSYLGIVIEDIKWHINDVTWGEVFWYLLMVFAGYEIGAYVL